MSEQNRNIKTEDELSLKDVILKLKSFLEEILRYWWILALFILPILAFKLYKHFQFEPKYKAKLTFMVNTDEGGGNLAGMSSVLGTFGLGGGSGGDYNLEKMLQLLRSRKIVQTILFKKAKINGKTDFFANHFIREYDFHQDWSNDTTGLNEFTFTNIDQNSFKRFENNALLQLYGLVIGDPDKKVKPVLTSEIGENTGIMTIEATTLKEELSIAFIDSIFHELSDYYVLKTIEKQEHTYQTISAKSDSIALELRNAEFSLAKFMDTNRGLYNKTDQLNQMRLEAKVKMLLAAFGKIVEQKEMAEFALRDRTPVIQVIDRPIPPISPSKSSLVMILVISCLVGGFLGAIFIVARKILREILN